MRYGRLALEFESGRALVDSVDIGLSKAEFALTYLLLSRRGVPLSKDTICAALATPADPRMIDVYIRRARAKLASAGLDDVIETVWGSGYRIDEQDRSEPAEPTRLRGLGAALMPA